MREATTSMKIFGRLINARIASVLICLLWLLPSVVNERGTSLAFCLCLRLLQSRTCSKVKVHSTVVPRNLKLRNLILGTLSSFSRKFPPTKITRYTVHDRVTVPSSAIVHSEKSEVPSSVSGPLDTSGSANLLETQCHADSSQSSVPKFPTSSLSDTMDKLLMKPKLNRKTRRQGRSHNAQAVCITDDEFVCKLKYDEKQQKDGNKQQKKSSKKGKQPAKNHPRAQKTNTDCKSAGNYKPRCKQKKQKQQQRIRKPQSERELRPLKGQKSETKDKRQELRILNSSKPKSDEDSEDNVLGSESESQSDCECPVCGEHFGDRSATWIQCNECEEWYDVECAGVTAECAEELPDDYICDFCCQ